MAKYLAQDLSQASAGYLLVAMGSGRSSFASQVQQARVADLQKVVADFTPEESEKVKVALKQVLPANRRQRRVRGGGKTENCRSLAPTLGRTDLAEEPARTKDFKPASSYWSSARWLHCNIRWWATPGRQQVFIIRNCWRMGRKWLRLCGLIWLCRMHRLQNGPAVCHYWILLGWRMWISLQALMMVEILTSKMILHEWKLNQTNPRSRMQMMALTSPNISKSMKWWVASSRTRVASSTIPCFRILFQMCLTLFSRGEGGKHFDDVQAFNWVYDILRWVTASGQSVMDTWRL